jgi:hypothetical protein
LIDTAGRSVRNYEVKLRLGACGRLSEAEISRRVDNYAARAYKQQAIVVQVRQALCNNGIVPFAFPMYHAYSRELGKLQRQDCSAGTRRELLRTILAKWTARGLSEPALKEVAECVFNLYLPASPEA